jgi:hypothetical protein
VHRRWIGKGVFLAKKVLTQNLTWYKIWAHSIDKEIHKKQRVNLLYVQLDWRLQRAMTTLCFFYRQKPPTIIWETWRGSYVQSI